LGQNRNPFNPASDFHYTFNSALLRREVTAILKTVVFEFSKLAVPSCKTTTHTASLETLFRDRTAGLPFHHGFREFAGSSFIPGRNALENDFAYGDYWNNR